MGLFAVSGICRSRQDFGAWVLLCLLTRSGCVANVRSFALGLGCSRVLFWLVSVCLLVVYWFGDFALGLMS